MFVEEKESLIGGKDTFLIKMEKNLKDLFKNAGLQSDGLIVSEKNEAGMVYIAYQEKDARIILVLLENPLDHSYKMNINSFYITERGKGIGTKIIEGIETIMKNYQIQEIQVLGTYEESMSWWSNRGYKLLHDKITKIL